MKWQDFTDKTILITGASSGIGAQTACELAREGASLILSARRIEYLNDLKIRCEQLGAKKVWIFPLDIAQASHIDRLIQFIQLNNITVDGLINNAGIGDMSSFIKTDFNRIEELFKVNVLGLMYLTQKIAIHMLDQGQGQIINIASLAGKVPTAEHAIYSASKAAVISFSHSLRMELKNQGIKVNVINFGPVATPFFDKDKTRGQERVDYPFYTLETKEAAIIIKNTLGTNKREVNRPIILAIGTKLYQLAPYLVEKILENYFEER